MAAVPKPDLKAELLDIADVLEQQVRRLDAATDRAPPDFRWMLRDGFTELRKEVVSRLRHIASQAG